MTEKLLEYFKGDTLPAGVWADKYQMKDKNKQPLEDTPDNMHRRMAKEFARKEFDNIKGDFNTRDTSGRELTLSDFGVKLFKEWNIVERDLEEVFYNYFKDFRHIIPQGSIMSVLGNTTKVGSLSNCFVIPPPYDSYGGIFKSDQHLAQLMKRRGGVGMHLNTLRTRGAFVSNAASTSTGAVSFEHRYSHTTREVAQDDRRGALMLLMSCLHPEIFDHVKIKDDRTKVTGANLSTMLTDKFMQAAENNEDFLCRFPIDVIKNKEEEEMLHFLAQYIDYNQVKETIIGEKELFIMKIHARELFDLIIEMAWKNGEPGLAFMDAIHNYSPDGVYAMFKAIACNPCGEQWLQAYDSCRLIALNLFGIIVNSFTPDAYIDYEKLYELCYVQQRLADVLVDLEIEYIDRIIAKIESDPEPEDVKATELNLWRKMQETAKAGRRTGCGITGLADMLAAVGVKYDSDEGLAIMEKVFKTKMKAELDCTMDLAELRGTFEGWDKNAEFHWNDNVDTLYGNNDFYQMFCDEFPDRAMRMWLVGRRNVSWSTIAPTGSLSILGRLIKYFNISGGMEPQFALWFFRNRKVHGEGRVDFIDQNGDKWQQYPVVMGAFRDWYDLNKHIIYPDVTVYPEIEDMTKDDLEYIYERSPWYQCTANDINWEKRVEIQALLQRYTTNAISSTINLPKDVAKEEVAKIYWAAWKAGLKGITVYRDTSRTGVLVREAVKTDEFGYVDAVKRPKTLEADLSVVTVKGQRYGVIVGLYNGNPYEVFAFEAQKDLDACSGEVTKVKKGRYDFHCPERIIEHIEVAAIHPEEQMLTRLVSSLLRHGANPLYIIEQINKCPIEIVSFGKAISRVLKKFVKEGEKASGLCENCGSTEVIYKEGCKTCGSCGHSRC